MAWTILGTASLGADKIWVRATAQALYDNVTAMAERLTNAPIVQVPVLDVKTTGTAATWTWPDGATAVEIIGVGGGGGSDGGVSGGDTTVTYNSVTYTGSGGAGSSGATGGAGGGATNGTLNIPGGGGHHLYDSSTGGNGGSSYLGNGALAGSAGSNYGGGAGGRNGVAVGAGGGGGGGTFIVRIAKVPGLNTITYTVGAGANDVVDGGGGVIIFKY